MRHHPFLGPEIASRMMAIGNGLRDLLTKAIKRGELPSKTNPDTLANAMLALVMGLASMSKVTRGEAELVALSESFRKQMGIE